MKLEILFIVLIKCLKVWAQADFSSKQTVNLQLITADSQDKTLSLNLSNSQHNEVLLFDAADGQLKVKGSFDIYYADTMTDLIVDYVADTNGYRASFKIFKEVPSNEISFETRLSNNSLKSLAG